MQLQAGTVTADYADGFVRYIRVGDQEIVRMIYFAIRDQNWKTLPFTIKKEKIHAGTDNFTVNLTSYTDFQGVKFTWKVRITGLEDGTIHFVIKGKAQSQFLKNRIGLCVLHSTDSLAGRPCSIEHSGGYFSHQFFPEYISPHQTFLNVNAMQWLVNGSITARLDFEGEIFETEDQRNWSDASFKTYCTPLKIPFPVEVKKDDEFNQSVRLTMSLGGASYQAFRNTAAHISLLTERQNFPSLGLQLPSDFEAPEPYQTKFLSKTGFSHLRANIFLSAGNWEEKLGCAFVIGNRLKLPLELVVFVNDELENSWDPLIASLKNKAAQIQSVAVMEGKPRITSNRLIAKYLPLLRCELPEISIGAGTDANFAELNRNSFVFDDHDFVCYSLNPQAHLPDNLTMVENMPAQFDQVRSAQRLAPGKRVHVSPVTLKPRFNAVATTGDQGSNAYDERQDTEFAAAWTLGSLKYLSEAGVTAITYFETTGPGGIMKKTTIFPVGILLGFILKWQPHEVQLTQCDLPLKVSSLLVHKPGASCLLLANHSTDEQNVTLPDNMVPVQIASIVSCCGDIGKPMSIGNDLVMTANQVVAVMC
ncbi:hypothetical protein [Dyadobacter pollutisoli]|uniref:Uncharacterized protein n=1 Tax=Dyadobacter pollutisoli TaxID=2910158 RepID=A0A9E8SNU5_9BACT|nr:hypothetical protein [Dyadobacter pollutisoli]WAC14056.1 hypothetical protein ON006_08855 [Dyadobacter pollutisoli]